MRNLALCALAALLAPPAFARDYCPDRPGIDDPACTMEPGRLSVEAAGLDWTVDSQPDSRTDTLLFGDLALRYGIAGHAELRLGWTPYGRARSRDRASGAVDTLQGTGDVMLGLRRNIAHPDGEGLSAAVEPWLILPTGGKAIGAGDWGAGMRAPVSFALSDAVSLLLTPEIDAAVDEDRHGRHIAWGTAGGLALTPRDGLTIALEASAIRDDDPEEHTTQAVAGLSAGLMIGKAMQLDAGAEFALNRATPDAHLYFGISRRF